MIIAIIIFVVLALGFLFYASYSIRAGIYLKSVCRIPTNEKVVALTFDDGPHPYQTPKVLDVLKEYNIPATFFCIGSKIAGNEEILHRMVQEGHSVGNHSYTHAPNFPLYPVRRMVKDLLLTQNTLEDLLQKDIHIFRPPFGVTNPTIAKATKRLGYKSIGWNIRSMDTSFSHPKVLKRIRKRLRPGSIILLHDRMSESDKLTREIVQLLRKENYRIIPLI
ncbi:polysaccharide deacetylase family protein [Bacteroides sp. 224]|uniref:polysaccharide deacetylase family protein n=1 Tax=Bacteroides sp. 224 TaxID=2302936 RepID=UPI0013D8066D|nr:polysaccharide deacetylase family protein [Bacteroides sp. 224]NDV66996.1 polysaccharide deacetylase family protein [Bacteroides sp. 224]